ncbi:lysine decarboxylase [Staphylococcus intermedius]|uniref:Orn Lys Arg decarboxylase family protein n=1 Tax=Staphylococcus intermedius NCTC 11048 TaxID=1141106 RepID=A0A380G5M2_STAIN|nr:lysine decarboxylase [Staphylococcus intermedius]PCF62488.1 lysine decarboxylase [Staphylococcus intermedius]PCF77887.1 lysine decarboxylase [Staphylococcus intermedius]PCF78259.1 lysine decarboxylase [Staphylococcus intermedius]PCF85829.1 lysine decarboxylase [Staphylococcus intermedius]PNZ54873.1 lysine decarboxylase [Staphylococcus intermedius NCTC 11048]
MQQPPLRAKMLAWRERQPISMHVPGHKNGTIGDLSMTRVPFDVTEITGFDNLHHAEAVLYESMQQLNKHPDYRGCFLVNGTTSGILAVIHALASIPGDVAIVRNVHKSVFHALELGQQSAQILATSVSKRTGQYCQPDVGDTDLEHTKLGVVTYPNYYGETFDIGRVIEQFHQSNVPVLVDEAHGAHFDLSGFPKSSMQAGADYVVQSYHKTLPSLTMSSVLWIHKDAPYREWIEYGLQVFQSSSPSYLLMESLEAAQTFYESYDSTLFFEKRKQLIVALENKGLTVITPQDPLKLLIQYEGMSGSSLQAEMEAQAIDVELSDEDAVLWILPLWHEQDRFPFEPLLERIERMTLTTEASTVRDSQPQLFTKSSAYQAMGMHPSRPIPYQQAEGCTLARHLTPYPPGIPSLLKGEIVTADMIKLIEYWQSRGFHVEGLTEGKITVKDE